MFNNSVGFPALTPILKMTGSLKSNETIRMLEQAKVEPENSEDLILSEREGEMPQGRVTITDFRKSVGTEDDCSENPYVDVPQKRDSIKQMEKEMDQRSDDSLSSMSEKEMDEMMNSEFAKLDLRTAKSLHASNKLNRTRNQEVKPIYYSIDQVK